MEHPVLIKDEASILEVTFVLELLPNVPVSPCLQTLKNALSPYKLGGAAGGSDFDPKGKSDNEVKASCILFTADVYGTFNLSSNSKYFSHKLADYAILPKFHE